jgi:hypothetical protein
MVSMSVWHVEQNPELITELGRVTVRWAALDLLLARIAAVALRNPPAAWSTIFDKSNAGQGRFRVFDRMIGASFFDEDERSTILRHTETLSTLYSVRNSLTHEPLEGRYSIDGKRLNFHLQFISRKGSVKAVSIEDISAHVSAVDDHLVALESVLDHLSEKYVPLEQDESCDDQHGHSE